MRLLLPGIFIFILSLPASSQPTFSFPISKADSLQVLRFWNTFSQAIEKKDKAALESVFQFPFDCRQCLDYEKDDGSDRETLQVTRKLFRDTVYNLFYTIPGLSATNQLRFKTGVRFLKANETGNRTDMFFMYVIIEPSATWEGAQGQIYIKKRNGRYYITALDIIP